MINGKEVAIKLGIGFKEVLIIATVIGSAFSLHWRINDHLSDEDIHMNIKEAVVLDDIATKGLPYNPEQETRVTLLENRLNQYDKEGRLQTPEQKKDLFKEEIAELRKDIRNLTKELSSLQGIKR